MQLIFEGLGCFPSAISGQDNYSVVRLRIMPGKLQKQVENSLETWIFSQFAKNALIGKIII